MLYQRKILSELEKVLNRDEFIILSGPRQVGKTSILLYLKEKLKRAGQICHFVNLENNQNLELLNQHPFKLFELIPQTKAKQTIFIDEIQYLDDPSNFLKLLYDEKRSEIKIIACGSSSFYLDRKFKDSLAGRKFLFEVFPLDFEEFLTFQNEPDLLEQFKSRQSKKITKFYEEKLDQLWADFITFGGYPKVAQAADHSIKKIILEEIGNSYVKKDIVEAGIREERKYLQLLKILAEQAGNLVNAQELASTLGVTYPTIEEYLYVAEKSYHIIFIRPFFKSIRKELIKMPKVFFLDLGLRNLFLNNFEFIENRADKGAYLENLVFTSLLGKIGKTDQIKFWRTQDGKEIDFVYGSEALEVKFDLKNFKPGKLEVFSSAYPEIKLHGVGWQELRDEFGLI